MAKKNYDQLVEQLVGLIGGKSNISFFTHCVTRLRFSVKDKGLVNEEEVSKLEGVIGTKWSGEQFQVVIGPNVSDVYKLLSEKEGFEQNDNTNSEPDKKKKLSLAGVLDGISGCITPLVPILIGSGFIKLTIMLLTMTGLLATDSSTHTILTFVGDAGFYFLPVFVGATSAKKFGANTALGMLIGAIFIHPTFMAAVANGDPLNIFGIPVYLTSYASTIFPTIITVWVMAPVERFISKKSPDSLRAITVPFLTLLVIAPLALLAFGPLGAFLGNYISSAIMWLYSVTGFLGVAVLSGLFPLLVLTGMHVALTPYIINAFAVNGFEPIVLTANIISNINQGFSCLAVGLKSKDKEIKATAFSCAVTALIGGVTEPALYAINLPLRTPLYGCMIGSFVGAGIAGFGQAYTYSLPGSGALLALPSFVSDGTSSFLWMVIGVIAGFAVTLISTLVLYKDEPVETIATV